MIRATLAGVGVLLLAAAAAGSAPRGAAAFVVVAGVGGTPEHRERFTAWASELCRIASAPPAPVPVHLLLERPGEAAASGSCAPRGRSTREELEAQLLAAGAGLAPGEGLLLVLIGHGTGGARPRFNLPGPDLAPEGLAAILARTTRGPVTVAHLGSAAGAFLPALSGPGRVVLAAARASETNETRFPRHFVAALAGAEADRNRDGRLSALEVFDFARKEVERDFDREGLLRTEHPVLDDNGDGTGSAEPATAAAGDGALAARTPLLFRTASAKAAASGDGDPEIAALLREREGLAARVDALRNVREGMEESDYLEELEALLLRIAEISEEIARLRGEIR